MNKAAISLLILLLAPPLSAQIVIRDVGQGPQSVSDLQLRGISGITRMSGDTYYVVDDIDIAAGTPQLHAMTIQVSSSVGIITGTSLNANVPFATGSQYESIQYNANTGRFFVCSEKDHSIRIVDGTGAQTGTVTVPVVYTQAAPNKSLESLAYFPTIDVLWTANEEALTVDSDFNAVRLQRFVGGTAAEQYVYTLEPPRNTAGGGFNGLSELLALPDGRLLALERDLDVTALNIAVRFFLIDLAGATDVSGLAGLNGETFTPVGKTDVMDRSSFPLGYLSSLANYEAVTLGPVLDDGSYSLVLGPSDDGDNGFLQPETLYPLKLEGVVTAVGDEASPEPRLLLSPSAPNPFTTATRFSLDLPAPGRVLLTIHDAAGRRVRTLARRDLPRGAHDFTWDGRDDRGRRLAAGLYLSRAATENTVATGRLLLVR